MGSAIPIPVPKCPKVIPAHPWHKLIIPQKVSTDRVEEAKEEQISVKVEERTADAVAADVRQLDQKVMKTKPDLWIENINICVNQHYMISLNPYIHVFIICIPA